jgi:hypothetical protein
MGQRTTREGGRQGLPGTTLEEWVGGKVQEMIQSILEEGVTELLGRRRSERREQVDRPAGYRNGYGNERNLTLRLCSGQAVELRHHYPTPAAGPWVRREI